MKERLIILFSLVVVSIVLSKGQQEFDPGYKVRDEVAKLIEQRYGVGYSFDYTMFDAQVYYSRYDESVQDPYGTLRGCVLFCAYREKEDYSRPDTFIVGMVKDGKIIWDNYPGSDRYLDGGIGETGLQYAQDINNDGEVDLLYVDAIKVSKYSMITLEKRIHILSWDGVRGRFISGLLLGSADCSLIDVDCDGVKEIRTWIWEHTDMDRYPEYRTRSYPYITYGWNGMEYGLWPGVRQVAEDEFLPANCFSAEVSCRVEKVSGQYVYKYKVKNDINSKQVIEWFFIEGPDDTTICCSPLFWTAGTSIIGGRRFSVDMDRNIAMIKPGETKDGFQTISVYKPIIVRYYIQGYVGGSSGSGLESERRNDILTNSVKGYTIGPADTVIVYIPLIFLDTLTSYTSQSLTLGWIKNRETAEKYLGYFNLAKQELEQNNINKTKSILQKVLQEVDKDSTSNLTSEAYALIRYNTEYLIERLPEQGK